MVYFSIPKMEFENLSNLSEKLESKLEDKEDDEEEDNEETEIRSKINEELKKVKKLYVVHYRYDYEYDNDRMIDFSSYREHKNGAAYFHSLEEANQIYSKPYIINKILYNLQTYRNVVNRDKPVEINNPSETELGKYFSFYFLGGIPYYMND